MALITGIPNFFNSAKPVQSDFNNAAKAICTQIGGTFYDEAGTAMSSLFGNIDSTNLVANTQFRNAQKAEPGSNFALSGMAGTSTQFVGAPYPDTIIFGGCDVPFTITGISVMGGKNLSNSVAGGSVDLYVNNVLYTTISFSNSVTTSTTTKEKAYTSLNIALNGGEMLWVDFANLNPFGGNGTWTVPAGFVAVSLLCRSLHVR